MSGAGGVPGGATVMASPVQGTFAFGVHEAAALQHLLEALSGLKVSLTVTHNRVRIISVRFSARAHATVRLRPEFLAAPESVLGDLGAYLRTRRREPWAAVAAFAQGIPAGAGPMRRPRVASRGQVWDLAPLYTAVNAQFFSGQVACRIGWGRGRPRRRVAGRRGRSIRYGSWEAATRTIRIHPLLDDARVPLEFLRYIIFHEMLHAVVPVEGRRGRRVYHPAGFRALERRYPDFARMRLLSRELLRTLT